MLDLDENSLALVKSIFAKHLPNVEVKAFGSRVTGNAKRFSDLDLVLIGKEPIPIAQLNELKFAFSNSDLPIMVDVVDWHALSDEFRQHIQSECEVFISLPSS